jgi:hypothetical protein
MAKTPIVSAKQLADSGFTNLRDYLNDKRGLTRKGEPVAYRRADPITLDSETGKSRGREPESLQAPMGESEMSRAAARAMRGDPNAAAREALSRGEGDEAGNLMKRGGSVKKMASGGSVGSASKRADGIAQRGKTRA